jgi:hypothetical protein
MNTAQAISQFITTTPEPKRSDLSALHQIISAILPDGPVTFFDGKNSEGKVVSNPTIGYGSRIMSYANGTSKESFQIGLSTNTTGISVYILGIDDKKYLSGQYGAQLGKASITGYCIKFRKLQDINIPVLETAIKTGIQLTTSPK